MTTTTPIKIPWRSVKYWQASFRSIGQTRNWSRPADIIPGRFYFHWPPGHPAQQQVANGLAEQVLGRISQQTRINIAWGPVWSVTR